MSIYPDGMNHAYIDGPNDRREESLAANVEHVEHFEKQLPSIRELFNEYGLSEETFDLFQDAVGDLVGRLRREYEN